MVSQFETNPFSSSAVTIHSIPYGIAANPVYNNVEQDPNQQTSPKAEQARKKQRKRKQLREILGLALDVVLDPQ